MVYVNIHNKRSCNILICKKQIQINKKKMNILTKVNWQKNKRSINIKYLISIVTKKRHLSPEETVEVWKEWSDNVSKVVKKWRLSNSASGKINKCKLSGRCFCNHTKPHSRYMPSDAERALLRTYPPAGLWVAKTQVHGC